MPKDLGRRPGGLASTAHAQVLITPRRPRQPSTDLDDLQHLHAGDLAVAVQVVHVEGPVQLLLEAAPGGDGQGADELPEVDGAVPVLVKGAEGVLGKLGGVSVREELQSRTHTSGVGGKESQARVKAGVLARTDRPKGHSTTPADGTVDGAPGRRGGHATGSPADRAAVHTKHVGYFFIFIFFTTTNSGTLWTPTGCPTLQFNSDTNCPELAQTPQTEGSVSQDGPTLDASHKSQVATVPVTDLL